MKNAEQQLLDELAELQLELEAVRRRKPWRCPECKKTTQIRLLDLRVVEFYVPPEFSAGGDYWTEGENPEYNVLCPKCDQCIRLYHSKFSVFSEEWLETDQGKRDILRQKTWEITNQYRSYFKSKEFIQRK